MKTLTVNIGDALSEKAIKAVLDALKLEYEIDDVSQFQDETDRIMANSYLAEKISQVEKIWKRERVQKSLLKIHGNSLSGKSPG